MRTMTNDIMISALKAVRRENREQEIALYGKTLCLMNVVRNRKKYTRKCKHKGNDW